MTRHAHPRIVRRRRSEKSLGDATSIGLFVTVGFTSARFRGSVDLNTASLDRVRGLFQLAMNSSSSAGGAGAFGDASQALPRALRGGRAKPFGRQRAASGIARSTTSASSA